MQIKASTVNTCLCVCGGCVWVWVGVCVCVCDFKNINWDHVEFDEGKSHFLPFFVVYHILSETKICPFVYGFF